MKIDLKTEMVMRLPEVKAYWERKKLVWSETTYKSEFCRFKKLCNFGFPTIEPADLFQTLEALYGRYTVKQFFIRAANIEEAITGEQSKYLDWMEVNPSAFRGAYVSKTRYITNQEIYKLFVNAELDYPFLVNLLVLMSYAGLRYSEAVNVQWTDVNKKAETLYVRKGKGRKSRVVPFIKEVQRKLTKHDQGPFVVMKDGKRLRSPKYWVDKLGEAAGVKVTPHDLRARAITRASKFLEPWELAHMAGHESIQTTMRYVRVSPVKVNNKLRESYNEEQVDNGLQ